MKKTISFALTTFIFIGMLIVSATSATAQKSIRGFQVPTNVPFYIQSALAYQRSNQAYWDIPGNPKTLAEDMEVKIWELSDRDHDRQYTFLRMNVPGPYDYYEIRIGNTFDARVTASGGKKGKGLFKKKGGQKDGQIIVKRAIQSDAQAYYLEHMVNGRFQIINIHGEVIGLDGGKTNGGTMLILQNNNRSLSQQWVLINARTNEVLKPTPPPRQTRQTYTPPAKKSKPKKSKPQKKSFKSMLK